MRRFLYVLILATAALLTETGTARADGQNAAGTTAPGGGQVVVVAPGHPGGGGGGSGSGTGGSSNVECKFFATVTNPRAILPDAGGVITDTSGIAAGTPVWIVCRDTTTGAITFQNVFAWDPANPPVVLPTAEELAQMALNNLRLPAPGARSWPSAAGRGLVNLPVWLHVDNWRSLSASASAGGLTATVEAVPSRAVWDMDEGSVVCTDAGVAYSGTSSADQSTPPCSYTYRSSSGSRVDQTFHNQVTVVWHLRWHATNGQGADLGEQTSPPAAFSLQIEESQALVGPSRG